MCFECFGEFIDVGAHLLNLGFHAAQLQLLRFDSVVAVVLLLLSRSFKLLLYVLFHILFQRCLCLQQFPSQHIRIVESTDLHMTLNLVQGNARTESAVQQRVTAVKTPPRQCYTRTALSSSTNQLW